MNYNQIQIIAYNKCGYILNSYAELLSSNNFNSA